jgi:opacity protein-like surface antigen
MDKKHYWSVIGLPVIGLTADALGLLLVGLCLLIGASLFGEARAADVYSRAVVEAPLPKLSGAYFVTGVGMAFSETAVTPLALSSKGGVVDARIGYDWQFPGGKWVIGPFIGIGLDDVTGKGALTADQRWHYEAGGRLGYVFNDTDLVYVLAAWRSTDFKYAASGFAVTDTASGFEYGAGVEFRLANHVTLGLEATRTDYGSFAISGVTIDNSDYNGKVRLGYHW